MLDASFQSASEPVGTNAPLQRAQGETPRLGLSRKAQIAWRRAVDELLIDAIFGPGWEPSSALDPVPIRVRSTA